MIINDDLYNDQSIWEFSTLSERCCWRRWWLPRESAMINQDKRKKQQFHLKIKTKGKNSNFGWKSRKKNSSEHWKQTRQPWKLPNHVPTKTATKHPSITLGSPKILANLANWSNWLNPKLDVGRSFNSKHKSGKNKPSPKYWWLESDEKNVYALSTSAEFLDHMCYFAFPVDFFLLLSQDLYSDFIPIFCLFPNISPQLFLTFSDWGPTFSWKRTLVREDWQMIIMFHSP